MAVIASEQKAQMLSRLLNLRDHSPLILIVGCLAQSPDLMLDEFMYHKPPDVTVARYYFEHKMGTQLNDPGNFVAEATKQISEGTKCFLIDNLEYLDNVETALLQIMKPGVTVIGTIYYDDVSPRSYYPSKYRLLNYMATSIIKIKPSEEYLLRLADNSLAQFDFDRFNNPTFIVELVRRKHNGRETCAIFMVDSSKHIITFRPTDFYEQTHNRERQLLNEITTTFKLDLTEKQKQAKDEVQLPYFDAQDQSLHGTESGAVVYHFEKEDDYDEEDPYEDPI